MTDSEYITRYTRDTSGYIKIHKYLCIQLITHRIAVGVGVERLRKQVNSSVVGVGRFRPVFYVMCYVMQDSSSRVRLSTELDECVCLLGALSGPTASSPCSHPWPR